MADRRRARGARDRPIVSLLSRRPGFLAGKCLLCHRFRAIIARFSSFRTRFSRRISYGHHPSGSRRLEEAPVLQHRRYRFAQPS
ncbi:putative 30S ribosomal protein S16 [Burkholderia mallei]|nr:putative 30S ribosomal protein S16 [Burkholderia mallei]KOT07976.1 putative 30S ribosomal protein S16 [Burkholderia mallei]